MQTLILFQNHKATLYVWVCRKPLLETDHLTTLASRKVSRVLFYCDLEFIKTIQIQKNHVYHVLDTEVVIYKPNSLVRVTYSLMGYDKTISV